MATNQHPQKTTDNRQLITDQNRCQHTQLTSFVIRSIKDPMIKPTHISLYLALFQFWHYNGLKNPINIDRKEVMEVSKIASKATYHKCMAELHNKGYIKYLPSNNPFKSSMVYLIFKDVTPGSQ